MNKYILFSALIISNSSFADCLFPKYMIDMAQQTGGGISCQDKEYYQNKVEIDKLNRVGMEGNCIQKGEDLFCKSGTSIKYKSPEEIKFAIEEKNKLENTPVKKFMPINEPHWFDRPQRPGEWYGENCAVRVWQKKGGQSDELIMYRHGGREDLYANIDGVITKGLAYTESIKMLDGSLFDNTAFLKRNISKPDFLTNIRFQGSPFFKLVSKKVGQCISEKEDSKCLRAEGFILYSSYLSPEETWRLAKPINVIVEDSCAKNKNSNFLDSRSFWNKIPVPH